MSLARMTAHTVFVLTALAAAACGASTTPTTASTTTDSALVVSPSEGSKSLTLTSDGGACGDAKTLINAHTDELHALCAKNELPLPGDVSKTGCDAGEVLSITFRCAVAKLPPVPGQGCRRIEVKDDKHAMSTGGAEHVASLPAVLCPMLGGAPPPPPPGAPGGPRPPKGDAPAGADGERPTPAPFPGAPGAPGVPGDRPFPGTPGGPDGPLPAGPDAPAPGGQGVPTPGGAGGPGGPGEDAPRPPVGGGGDCAQPPPFLECCAPEPPVGEGRPDAPAPGEPRPDAPSAK